MRFLRENLAVCGFADITRPEAFAEYGFDCQLQLVEGHDKWLQESIDVLCLPFLDGLPIPPAQFHEGFDWLNRHWVNGDRILISCAAGESRSVSMAIALLSHVEQVSFISIASEVIANVPRAYPHPVTLASAASLAGFSPIAPEDLANAFKRSNPQPQFPWPDELIQQAVDDWDHYRE